MRARNRYLLWTFLIIFLSLLFWQVGRSQSFKQPVIDAHRPVPPEQKEAVHRIASRYQAWERSNEILGHRPELRGVRTLNIDQILSYDALARRSDELRVRWDERGAPIFISGAPLQRSRSQVLGEERGNEHTVRSFFLEHGDLLGCPDAGETFVLQGSQSDRLGYRHLRYVQQRGGVPVWGKEIVCGLQRGGDLEVITGRIVPSALPVRGAFRLSTGEAVEIAGGVVPAQPNAGALDPSVRHLLQYDGPVAEQYYYDDGDCLRPVHVVEIRPNLIDRWRVFVDADAGDVLLSYNATCHDGPAKSSGTDLMGQTRQLETYQHQGTYFLIDATRPMFNAGASSFPHDPVGAILTLDAHETGLKNITHVTSPGNSWSDASAVSAHANAGIVYEYFRTTFNRNAIDDKGSTMISVVNVGDNGQPMENAFWNGKLMAYGNGGQYFEPFAKALDVAAHEMAHGVTEHSAGLEYLRQSGAMNEAFSDIFGAMVDREDWKLGEDITRVSNLFPTGTMRDFEDPHNGGTPGSASWQPKHMNEYQNLPESEDNGGVHTNSGIINHCTYLLAQQIGREKTEQIMYRVLTTKLTKQSQFIDFRLGIIRSAEELYGAAEAQACANACDQVGILDGNPTGNPTDVPPVAGADRMLLINTDATLSETLWIAVPPASSAQDFTPISLTNVWGRPSISDDGVEAVFVDTDNNLRSIKLTGTPNEQVLDNSGIWHSVALSRDRRRIAVTTTDRVPELFVIDLSGPTLVAHKFAVYTPNYSEGEIPNTARFVDAMEFSISDRFLLFDTYNEVDLQGSKLGFWDINIMDAWDKSQGTFGSGRIDRILPQDPSVNTGNPTFAKTKPTVIAFDAQFPARQESYVATMDALNGEPRTVVQLEYEELGYPSYSGDDSFLAFAYTEFGETSIYNLPMSADGVTPAGGALLFVELANVPLWFRTGSRPVSAEDIPLRPDHLALAQNYPNPFGPGAGGGMATTITFTLTESAAATVVITDMLGREVARLLDGDVRDAGTHRLQFNAGELPAGMYCCRLEAAGASRTRIMLLIR